MDPDTQTPTPPPQTQGVALTAPLAIVVAGLLIAGAIFLSRGNDTPQTVANAKENAAATGLGSMLLPIRPPNEATDHIRGNPNADVVVIEYSDTECPFCKRFHDTTRQLLSEYGKSGRMAWVYRHFPLVTLHSKAPKEAEALECAAELGGNSAFWNYTDSVFAVTPSNDGLDPALLPQIAEDIGLPREAFAECLSSGKFAPLVEAEYKEAVALGGTGTPYSVLVIKKPIQPRAEKRLREINELLLRQFPPGSPDPIVIATDRTKISITGAFQYPLMKEVVELLLK